MCLLAVNSYGLLSYRFRFVMNHLEFGKKIMMKLSRLFLLAALLLPTFAYTTSDDDIDSRNIAMLNMMVGHVRDGGSASINGRTYISVKGKLVPERLLREDAAQQ